MRNLLKLLKNIMIWVSLKFPPIATLLGSKALPEEVAHKELPFNEFSRRLPSLGIDADSKEGLELIEASSKLLELNIEGASIADIEAQTDHLESLLSVATNKNVSLINTSLTSRKNLKLDDPSLESYEGTKRVLEELTSLSYGYFELPHIYYVNLDTDTKHSLYWEV